MLTGVDAKHRKKWNDHNILILDSNTYVISGELNMYSPNRLESLVSNFTVFGHFDKTTSPDWDKNER